MADYNKAPEITPEMKRKYLADAERQYRNMTPDKLEKEYKKLSKDRSLWGWIRERVGSFVNMVKIAALSVFLGRDETSKRIRAGNREAEFEKLKKEAQKDAKIDVIEKRLNELNKENPEKEAKDQEKEQEQEKDGADNFDRNPDSPNQDKTESKAEPVIESETEKEEHDDISVDDAEKNHDKPEQSTDKSDEKSESQSEPQQKPNSIYGEQIQQMSDKYKDGLLQFLEMQTGIKREFISVENVAIDNGTSQIPCIQVSLSPQIINPERQAAANLSVTTLTPLGNTVEKNSFSKQMAKAVLYYTSEIYRESKNKNNRIIGTLPSEKSVNRMMKNFVDLKKSNSEQGIETTSYQKRMFGHKISLEEKNGQLRVFIDGKEQQYSDGFSTKTLHQQINETIKNDYLKDINIIRSQALHDFTQKNTIPECRVHYQRQDLHDLFTKTLNDITSDNGKIMRDVDFHGHEVHVELLDDKRTVKTLLLDGNPVYMEKDGHLDNDKIAEQLVSELIPALEKTGNYQPEVEEQQAWEKADAVIEQGEIDEYATGVKENDLIGEGLAESLDDYPDR